MVGWNVLQPPYAGVRAFLDWATDLYPYINGKCLMSGVVLEELESSDMLDVIHFLLEDDTNFSTSEQLKAQRSMRSVIYKTFYNRKYRYAADPHHGAFTDDYEYDDDFNNFTPPTSNEVKPYIPPTNFNPDSDNPFGLKEKPLG
jgi:hypothetical protein